MSRFRPIAAAAALCAGALGFVPAQAAELPPIECSPQALAKIDGSTAADARKAMTAAGYTQIADLKKGCDNYWHARAAKNGRPTGVLLAPDGQVRPEGLE